MKYEVDMLYCEVDKPVSIDCPIVRVMFALLCFFSLDKQETNFQ